MLAQEMDLNADAGESFGRWVLGADAELLPLVTTVNIACGFHAGDPATMRTSLVLAREAGISVGAHPGYPDLLGFGRRRMPVSVGDAIDYIVYQTGALYGLAATEGVRLTHVKPHGSLYGQVSESAELAVAVARQLQSIQPGLALLVSPGEGASAVRAAGLPVVLDAATDLEYDDTGTNIIEPLPAAKDPQLVADRALGLAEGHVTTVSGRTVPLRVQSLCVHGDRPNAPAIARAVRQRLEEEGVRVRSAFDGKDASGAGKGNHDRSR
jgi:5-oxoprolinase (ATP-hydrolysing) subunit A